MRCRCSELLHRLDIAETPVSFLWRRVHLKGPSMCQLLPCANVMQCWPSKTQTLSTTVLCQVLRNYWAAWESTRLRKIGSGETGQLIPAPSWSPLGTSRINGNSLNSTFLLACKLWIIGKAKTMEANITSLCSSFWSTEYLIAVRSDKKT